MELAAIVRHYRDKFVQKYRQRPEPFGDQLRALNAILACRTPACGEMLVSCSSCGCSQWVSHSCGHRSCPKCQNHEATVWLQRQSMKLLPVDYFLVTFTLPAQLRGLAYTHRRAIFDLLFKTSAQALRELAANPRFLDGEIGLTGVLHTHSRKLDYHPHVHYLVPGFAFNSEKNRCHHAASNYLVPQTALNRLFRGKFLSELKALAFSFDPALYRLDWVVDCQKAGKGEPALRYLSRYLYRGVVSEKNIIGDTGEQVTFRYVESKTGKTKTRTLKGEDFLHLVLQHTLPKGFRRARNYGFLHGNAARTLRRLQLLLRVRLKDILPKEKPVFPCPDCGAPMRIIQIRLYRQFKVKSNRSPPTNEGRVIALAIH